MPGPPLPWFLSYPAAFAVLALSLILNIWTFGNRILMAGQIVLLFAAALWLLLGLPYAQARYREKRTRTRAAFSKMLEEGLSEEEKTRIRARRSADGEDGRAPDSAGLPGETLTAAPEASSRADDSVIDPGGWLSSMEEAEKRMDAVLAAAESESSGKRGQDWTLAQEYPSGEGEAEASVSFQEAPLTHGSEEPLTGLSPSLSEIREILEREVPLSVDMAEVYCLQEGYGLNEALGEINLEAEARLGRRLFQVKGEQVVVV